MKNTPRCPVCGSKGMYYRKKRGDFYCKLCNSTTLYSNVIWDNQKVDESDALRCLKLIRDDLRATQKRLEECKIKAKAEGFSDAAINAIIYPPENDDSKPNEEETIDLKTVFNR